MPNSKDQRQRLQAKRAVKLLDDWLTHRTCLTLSLHLNVGVLLFLGEVFQRQDECFYFRNRNRDFALIFSPIGSVRIRLRKSGARRRLELDTHRYLIEGIKAGQYDSIILQEFPAGVRFSSPEELAATVDGLAP